MSEIDVAWLLAEGDGGALDPSGGMLIIPGAIPGDRVRVLETERRGRTHRALRTELIAPSPDRRPTTCPWSATCGGCDLEAMNPDARLAAISASVTRLIRWSGEAPIVRSPRPTGHRARIKLNLDDGRVGFRAERSHDLVEITACQAARPELQPLITRLLSLPTEDLRGYSAVELRTDGERACYAFTRIDKQKPDTDRLAPLGDVAVDGRRMHGDPTLWIPSGGRRLRASPLSFYQVNLEVNELLVSHVNALVAEHGSERLIDLYAGIGNLGLGPATARVPVVAVEREGQATSDLTENARRAGANVTVKTAVVERFDLSREAFDVALLDPPRQGAPGMLEKVFKNRPRLVVYVACDPTSAARDLKALEANPDYSVRSVRLFDMFPDTHHVETVIEIVRRKR